MLEDLLLTLDRSRVSMDVRYFNLYRRAVPNTAECSGCTQPSFLPNPTERSRPPGPISTGSIGRVLLPIRVGTAG